jgi:hypothetical protein
MGDVDGLGRKSQETAESGGCGRASQGTLASADQTQPHSSPSPSTEYRVGGKRLWMWRGWK